jgi:apoptosis-inducing factor 3
MGGMFMAGFFLLGGLYLHESRKLAEAEPAVKEVEIEFASELEEGSKRSLKVGDKDEDKILIVKFEGKIYAVGNFCSHFGVPLEGGPLFEDKIMCPAHGAAFSVVSGLPEDAPGLNGLPIFPVVEKDGKHYVQIPEGALPKSVAMKLSKRDPENSTHFVIIGGGAAGLNAAETLRQSGFTGRITMLTNED